MKSILKDMSENQKIVDSGETITVKINVTRKASTDEWVCRVYFNGKYSEGASYYTDSKQDAIDTRKVMLDHLADQGYVIQF